MKICFTILNVWLRPRRSVIYSSLQIFLFVVQLKKGNMNKFMRYVLIAFYTTWSHFENWINVLYAVISCYPKSHDFMAISVQIYFKLIMISSFWILFVIKSCSRCTSQLKIFAHYLSLFYMSAHFEQIICSVLNLVRAIFWCGCWYISIYLNVIMER